MIPTASALADRLVAGGEPASAAELLELLEHAPREELHEAAHRVTAALAPRRFDFCAIANARSGRCGEDCKWCAQSARWRTGCEVRGWIGTEACVRAAADAEANGAGRIGIVTSGRAQTPASIDALCDALRAMKARTRIHLCASLGLLSEADLRRLRDAGLERVHCNLETAPSLFGSLCTTHTQAQKLETLRAARILDSIAILRLANPRTPLRFAGGRLQLGEADARRAIFCGIGAEIAGPLLTTPGPACADDCALALEAGYDVSQPLREREVGSKKEEEGRKEGRTDGGRAARAPGTGWTFCKRPPLVTRLSSLFTRRCSRRRGGRRGRGRGRGP